MDRSPQSRRRRRPLARPPAPQRRSRGALRQPSTGGRQPRCRSNRRQRPRAGDRGAAPRRHRGSRGPAWHDRGNLGRRGRADRGGGNRRQIAAEGREEAEADQHRTKEVHSAKLIKLADKTSNLRAITASPSPEWSVKRRLECVKWARDVVAAVRGTNEWLEAEFDKAAEAADESVRP